MAVFH